MSSVICDNLKLSIFGESHGPAIGCVIDGFPSGVKVDLDKIYADMSRRAPGKDLASTPRLEKDMPQVLSGILDGVTTGAPIAITIENTNTKSGDYSNLKKVPRPSHSDYPAFVKYDANNDVRGGGHFSGRLTAPLVFAGSLAKQYLETKGIKVGAHISQIGDVCDDRFDMNNVSEELIEKLTSKTFSLINEDKETSMRSVIEDARMDGDSIGGKVECAVIGLQPGIGGNMFDTVEGRLSKILFGVPAVKGVEFGLGFDFASKRGSQVNDGYEIVDDKVKTITNNNGGILGGMTTGSPLIVSVAIKPTPSISTKQHSVNLETMENEILEIKGRHDPCIVQRANVVIECAVALGIMDILL